MHEENDGKKIKIMRNGPYMVTGDVPLTATDIVADEHGDSVAWGQGEAIEHKESYALCRCGHTSMMPFCDGAHQRTGFVGREFADRPPYEEHAERQRGEEVDLIDDPSLCMGARFCDKGETVWGYVEKSGIPEYRKRAIDEANNCPAGRLTVVDRDGARIEPPLPREIGVVDDPVNQCKGPLWVKGGIPIEGADGERYEVRNRVTLCRCGLSRNQPYCDGNHYNSPEMQDDEE